MKWYWLTCLYLLFSGMRQVPSSSLVKLINSCTSIAILSKMPSLAAAGLGIRSNPGNWDTFAPIPFFPEQSLFWTQNKAARANRWPARRDLEIYSRVNHRDCFLAQKNTQTARTSARYTSTHPRKTSLLTWEYSVDFTEVPPDGRQHTQVGLAQQALTQLTLTYTAVTGSPKSQLRLSHWTGLNWTYTCRCTPSNRGLLLGRSYISNVTLQVHMLCIKL